jgi:hypothetical protein
MLVELTELSDRDEELIFCTSTGYNAYLLAVQMALSVYVGNELASSALYSPS